MHQGCLLLQIIHHLKSAPLSFHPVPCAWLSLLYCCSRRMTHDKTTVAYFRFGLVMFCLNKRNGTNNYIWRGVNQSVSHNISIQDCSFALFSHDSRETIHVSRIHLKGAVISNIKEKIEARKLTVSNNLLVNRHWHAKGGFNIVSVCFHAFVALISPMYLTVSVQIVFCPH